MSGWNSLTCSKNCRMTTPRILATSGGFVAGPVQQSVRLGSMILDGLALTKKDRPRVCLVYTAAGDDARYYAMSYEAFNAAGCDVTELKLFLQPSADPTERLTSSDFVWVGGGSVANLLALWRLHGVDEAMRAAWEGGVILMSAGSLCWHIGGHDGFLWSDLAARRQWIGVSSLREWRALRLRGATSSLVAPTDSRTRSSRRWPTPPTITSAFGTKASRRRPWSADAAIDPTTGPAAYRVELVNGEGERSARWCWWAVELTRCDVEDDLAARLALGHAAKRRNRERGIFQTKAMRN